jgi:hypothetical protein
MPEKPNPFNILPMEFSPALAATVKKRPALVSQSFSTLLAQTCEPNLSTGGYSGDILKYPPLPDGTGRIINKGV